MNVVIEPGHVGRNIDCGAVAVVLQQEQLKQTQELGKALHISQMYAKNFRRLTRNSTISRLLPILP